MDAILHFDWNIFAWTERVLDVGHNPVLDNIFAFITSLGNSGLIWLAIGALMLFSKKLRPWGIAVMLGVAFSGLLNDLIIKPFFERPRPFDFDWPSWTGRAFYFPEIIAKPDSLSFPSGHTSSSFAPLIALWFIPDKKSRFALAIPGTILAALIGFSRIYVHVHYPTDVLGGIVAGVAYGLLAVLCVKFAVKLWQKKFPSSRLV
ncbi:MAG: phosphatase PAP2 family protein [Oscillospiraceae bacterium]|jgi:undecaprenyl-diphosphatase|nr:phosphatase PAP2 family protein [Oscillospiraceae bacterium]